MSLDVASGESLPRPDSAMTLSSSVCSRKRKRSSHDLSLNPAGKEFKALKTAYEQDIIQHWIEQENKEFIQTIQSGPPSQSFYKERLRLTVSLLWQHLNLSIMSLKDLTFFESKLESISNAIALLDRCILKDSTPFSETPTNIDIYGIVAFWVSSKYLDHKDIIPPITNLPDLLPSSIRRPCSEEIKILERKILNQVTFSVGTVTTETWVSWILENSGQCLSKIDFLTFKWLVRLVCFKMIVYLNGKYYLKPSEMVSIAVEVSWKIVSPTCSRFQFPALFPRISDHMLQRHLLQISRILTVKDGLSVIFEKIGQENCEKDLNELLFSRLKLHNMNAVNLIFHVPHPLPTPPLEKADFDLIPKHVGKQPVFT